MTHPPATTKGLPESLIDVAETLGLRVALKLMEAFGGQEVKFPKRPGADHPIVLALGAEDGVAVCSFLSGSAIYVPHAKASALRRKVAVLSDQGKGRAEIARLLGISQRHVRRVANTGGRTDPNQLDLFDE